MDTLLTAVAAVSLAIAAGMGVMVAKVVREERRRSEARMLALAELSAEQVPPGAPPRLGPVGPVPVSADDLTLWPSEKESGPAELFAERERSSPWGPRLAVIGALLAVVLIVVFAVASGHRSLPPQGNTAQAPAPQPPLELLSLRYQQQSDRMTITGLVRNPAGGAPLERVNATAFLFAEDGTFLASGRAPLDYTKLAPGDESPFVIAVAVSGTVARYRVGFRAEDGRVLAHVDRRAVGTMAGRDVQ